MQISLKLIQAINHAKSTVCIKFQLSSLFTGSSSLSVFPRGVLYRGEKGKEKEKERKRERMTEADRQ